MFLAEHLDGFLTRRSPVNPNINGMLHFTIQKTASDIRDAVTKKSKQLADKIVEREGRITRLREEYKIDDKALIGLLTEARRDAAARITKMSYTVSNSTRGGGSDDEVVIGAGLVTNLLTEMDQIENEKTSIKRLDLIARNIRPTVNYNEERGEVYTSDTFMLSYEELEYLGF